MAQPLLVALGMNPRKDSLAPTTPRQKPRRVVLKRAIKEDFCELGADFLRAVTSGSRIAEEHLELDGMREFQVNLVQA